MSPDGLDSLDTDQLAALVRHERVERRRAEGEIRKIETVLREYDVPISWPLADAVRDLAERTEDDE